MILRFFRDPRHMLMGSANQKGGRFFYKFGHMILQFFRDLRHMLMGSANQKGGRFFYKFGHMILRFFAIPVIC